MNSLTFRYAIQSDTPALFSLINSAYRGDTARGGWTHEADLVDGLRITEEELGKIIDTRDESYLLAFSGDDILGCVHLRDENEDLYFGMLAIRPDWQNKKIGSALMQEIENIGRQKKKAAIRLVVIDVRKELISYYERKGFVLTGRSEEFPSQYPAKIPGLLLLEMKKTL